MGSPFSLRAPTLVAIKAELVKFSLLYITNETVASFSELKLLVGEMPSEDAFEYMKSRVGSLNMVLLENPFDLSRETFYHDLYAWYSKN
jgi:hypothetical protein